MEIFEDDVISGLPIRMVRKILQSAKNVPLTVNNLSKEFSLKKIEAGKVIRNLIRLGYLQRHSLFKDACQCSLRGTVLIDMPLKRVMTPEKLEATKDILIGRIKKVNAKSSFLYKISNYFFVEEKSPSLKTYRRLIVRLTIVPKIADPESQEKAEEKRRAKYCKDEMNHIEYFFFCRIEVSKFIRRGLHNVEIHGPDSILKMRRFQPGFGEPVTVFEEVWFSSSRYSKE